MWPRLRLDLDWSDLAAGAAAVLTARSGERGAARVERAFGPGDAAVAGLSVRSLLDAWCAAAALPAGSEVVVSALTIPDVLTVLRAHGLVPVPVDVDPVDVGVRREELERRTTLRTRAVLVAHLFGARAELDPVADFCRDRRIPLLEDAAQAFGCDGWRGHPGADATFFSFGTIKTATALGGGVAVVRDPARRAAMRARRDAQPVQGRGSFAARVAKGTALHLLSTRPAFSLLARAAGDLDGLLHGAVRGFPGDALLEQLRRRPSAPLLTLLERRVVASRRERLLRRVAFGREVAAALGDVVPSAGAPAHVWWVVPVLADEPARLVAHLRSRGFDATTRSSLSAGAPVARELLRRAVFLPALGEAPPAVRRALLDALADARLAPLSPASARPSGTLAPGSRSS